MKKEKQILINFHMHSTGSDGRLSPEQVVLESINGGISHMCFTDHYPLPPKTKDQEKKIFSRKNFHNPEYGAEIKRLQEKYKDKITIGFGAEICWVPGQEEWIRQEIKRNNFDHVIGSVHLIFFNDTEYFSIDHGREGKETWLGFCERFGGIKKLVKEYYKQTRAMVKSQLFNCVGHFDLIKMYNKEQDLFKEDEGWYKEEVLKTLDVISKHKIALEINIRGLVKITQAPYPSLWILKEAKKRNIDLTIGTDCHADGEVNLNIDKALELAKEAGYTSLVRFKNQERFEVPLV